MKRYGNRNGNAGITAYEYGRDWIRIIFARGEAYEYRARAIGIENLEMMKQRADSGKDLTTFINTHPEVKNGYTKPVAKTPKARGVRSKVERR